MTALPPLLAFGPEQLADALGGPGRAGAVFRLLRSGKDPFLPGALGPRARERLAAVSGPTRSSVSTRVESPDGTIKARLGRDSSSEVEAVLIPTARRTTLCVSSQVGCGRGCVFCSTGTMGLRRHLKVEEILAQVVWGLAEAQARALPPLRNVVFMGMGEPLDNLFAVEAAVQLLTASTGWGFSPHHVTVSTVGPSPSAIARAAPLPAKLAWSVHAARDSIRRKLVPTARWSVESLRDAFGEVLESRGDSLFAEVTLMDGVNDGLADAVAVAELLAPLPGQTRVNLLPMNPSLGALGAGLRASPRESVDAFADSLRSRGLFCVVRPARGDHEGSACGQLAVGPPHLLTQGG